MGGDCCCELSMAPLIVCFTLRTGQTKSDSVFPAALSKRGNHVGACYGDDVVQWHQILVRVVSTVKNQEAILSAEHTGGHWMCLTGMRESACLRQI